ncbi:MAG: methyl-accepting chemotaxis protein, partial [Treponema sp.]|nr:methyl-accepting chemotaxis protein [Treponema sp.]
MKLKIRLTLIIATMMSVVVVSIAVVLLSRARSLQIGAAHENMKNLTGLHARGLESRYQTYYDMALSLTHVFNNFKGTARENRRLQFNNALFSLLESNRQ